MCVTLDVTPAPPAPATIGALRPPPCCFCNLDLPSSVPSTTSTSTALLYSQPTHRATPCACGGSAKQANEECE
eukprot:COSAG06_NODE_181_length_20926_cov_7.590051_2_plen_73_part_00